MGIGRKTVARKASVSEEATERPVLPKETPDVEQTRKGKDLIFTRAKTSRYQSYTKNKCHLTGVSLLMP